jgi:predicted nucleotidyltransferase
MLAITRTQAELLLALRREGSPRLVLIGATALHHHVSLPRLTADIDLVIVAELKEISELLTSHHWERDKKMWQRWYRYDSQIDVLPATARVLEAGVVRVEGADREMSIVGFDLALEHVVAVPIPGSQQTVDVASLAAIVVLKMVAWLDRPHERHKDLGDIACALVGALDDFDERRWASPLVDIHVEQQSAFFLGSEVAAIAGPAHRTNVAKFLALVATGGWSGVMAREARLVAENPATVAERHLSAFARGLLVQR